MAAPSNRLTLWSQYLATRLVVMAITGLSPRANLQAAAFGGRVWYRLDRRHRLRALDNVRLAYPDAPDEQINAIALAAYEHFIQLASEVLYTPRMLMADNWSQYVRLTSMGPTIQLLCQRRPAILVTGHLGNWEILGYLLAILGFRIAALARPIDNPLINDWLLGIRQKRGLNIINKFDASELMLRILSEGGVLGFIADQNAGDRGLFVPFFDCLASTYKSIGLLAMRKNVPIICGYAQRVAVDESTGSDFRYELGVTDTINPQDWADQPDPLFYITARYSRALEKMIRLRPGQYLWMHRRWKSRPQFELEGKPLPPALRRKLEQLPWMDEQQMRRLELHCQNPASSQ